jgi:hypothetical protein
MVPAPGDYEDGEFCGMMIGKETEVLGENLSPCHFVHHKSHMTRTGANPGRRCGIPATKTQLGSTPPPPPHDINEIKRLSYGMA